MNNKIIKSIDNPEKLEELYQLQKDQFKNWLIDAIKEIPDSETLKVWNARLNYSSIVKKVPDFKGITLVIFLSVLSFLTVKLPSFTSLSSDWFHPRFTPIIVIGALIVYFSKNNFNCKKQKIIVWVGLLLSVILMILLPDVKSSQTVVMAKIHMPFCLISLLAITFMSSSWKTTESRLKFIRYLGEVIIY